MGGSVTPSLSQTAFRFREYAGDLTFGASGPPAIADANTNIIWGDELFRIGIRVDQSATVSPDYWRNHWLWYSLNGGAYHPVLRSDSSDSATVEQAQLDPIYSVAPTTTTVVTTTGASSYISGSQSIRNSAITINSDAALKRAEVYVNGSGPHYYLNEYYLQLNYDVVNPEDIIRLRVYVSDNAIFSYGTYSQLLSAISSGHITTLNAGYSITPEITADTLETGVTGSLVVQEQGQDVFTAIGELVPLDPTGTLAAQEQGNDSFTGTAELDPQLPVYVSPIVIQEQGQDGFAATGNLTPQTYEVEYWDETTPETVTTITGIPGKDARLTGLTPAKNYGWRVRAWLSENFFSDWTPPGLVTTPTSWMDAVETGSDIFTGLSSNYLKVQEVGQDTASVTVTVTVTAVVAAQEELYDILAAAGAVAVQASLQAQGQGSDTFSGTMEQITIEVPTNLRVANVTRTTARFEWDEPV